MAKHINLIAAIDDKRGLARGGMIPWNLPADKAQFREKTDGKIVILGKRTYGEMRSMLGSRRAIVVSYENEPVEGAEVIHDLPAYLQKVDEDIWVIGGGQIFALALPQATDLYLTRVNGDFNCEVFFPEFEGQFVLVEESATHTENRVRFRYQHWVRA